MGRLLVLLGWCLLWGSVVAINLRDYDWRFLLVWPVGAPVGAYLVILGRRLRLKESERPIGSDASSAVLYLRSFQEDKILHFINFFVMVAFRYPWQLPQTSEEKLTSVMKRIGPVFAIGQPGERLPPLGATRIYVDNEDWQDVVRKYITTARAVLFGPGKTEAFWWEVSQAALAIAPDRLIFWFPNRSYQSFRCEIESRLSGHWKLPDTRKRVRFLFFKDDRSPVLITCGLARYLSGKFMLGANRHGIWLLNEFLARFDPATPSRKQLLLQRLVPVTVLSGLCIILFWLIRLELGQ